MKVTKKKIRTIFLLSAALTLAACQTLGSGGSKDEILFAGLEDKRATETQAAPSRKEDSTTCLRFYANATKYAAQPQGISFASGLMKTVAIGTISGIASGGVAAFGISSAFVEAAVIGTTSQVVYTTADQGWDKAFGKNEAVDPVTEISTSAQEVGCPPPSDAALEASKSISFNSDDVDANDSDG